MKDTCDALCIQFKDKMKIILKHVEDTKHNYFMKVHALKFKGLYLLHGAHISN